MGKRVDLIIRSIDASSNVISSIDRRLQGLQKTANGFTASSIAGGLAVGAGFAAVSAAINVATAAVGSFGTALSKAAEIQSETVILSGQLSTLLGKSYEETNILLDRLNDSIVKNAAALPGATDEYARLARQLTDSVIPAATRLDGTLDDQKLIDYTTQLASAYGLLAQVTPNLTSGEVLTTLTKAISGTATVAELSRLDLFQKNPILLRALREELTERGVGELKDLSEAARVEVLREVGNLILTPETIARVSQTLSGRIEGLFSALFDPTSGIFGFARKIDTRGGRRVIDAVNAAFGQFLDVISQIGSLLSELGFRDTGAIENIYDFFTWIAERLNALEQLISNNRGRILEALEFVKRFMQGEDSFGEFIINLGRNIGRLIGYGITQIDYQALNEFVKNLVLGVGTFLFSLLVGIGEGLARGVFEESQVLAENMRENMREVMLDYLTNLITFGLADELSSDSGKDARPLAQKIVDGINTVLENFINFFINGLNPVLGNLLPDIEVSIQDIAQRIKDAVIGLVTSIANAAIEKFNSIPIVPDIALPSITPTANTNSPQISLANKAFGNIPLVNAINTERKLAPGTNPVIANDSEYIFTQNQMKSLIDKLSNSGQGNTIIIQGVLDERVVKQIEDVINGKYRKVKNNYAY